MDAKNSKETAGPRSGQRRLPCCIYQLQIELQGIAPAIRRSILVPETLTLARLGRIITAAMGWNFHRRHEFAIAGKRYGVIVPQSNASDLVDERRNTLAHVLGHEVDQFVYIYDFDDGWRHMVDVQRRLAPIEGKNTWPMCIGGQNACPPDDIGGPQGYFDFLEALHNPVHRHHEHLWNWWGGPFDEKGFSLNEANRAIRRIR